MRIMKWVGRGVAGVVALAVVAIGGLYAQTQWAMTRPASRPTRAAITVPHDPATLATGVRMVQANGCQDCHGADLGGQVMVDDPKVFRLVASNLTSGEGGVLAHYDDAALDAAIRDGVGWDGRKLVFMPSHEFAGLADDVVASIIANIRTRPPVHRAMPAVRVGPIGRGLMAADKVVLLPYDRIDHARTTLAVAPTGGTLEQGRYLAAGCTGCHKSDYAGGMMDAGPPGSKPSANITPAGRIGTWSETQFVTAIRTGVRPDRTTIDPSMPWKAFSVLTDEELQSVYRYLRTLPPKPDGT
ncbi:MAG TPA: c-type cytochrome [Gemmatimonadaceae bacterium]|nr:c-type cytochrome [Gemmatimonadaceae bacterium]